MPIGFQALDAAGNIIVDVTTRLTRLTGTATIPSTGSGSIVVPNAAEGNIWFAIYPANFAGYTPNIYVVGNAIQYTQRGWHGTPTAVTIVYGVY